MRHVQVLHDGDGPIVRVTLQLGPQRQDVTSSGSPIDSHEQSAPDIRYYPVLAKSVLVQTPLHSRGYGNISIMVIEIGWFMTRSKAIKENRRHGDGRVDVK